MHSVEVEVAGRRHAVELRARRGLRARRLAAPPVLDGTLDEWGEPASVTALDGLGPVPASVQQTRAWLGYDGTALYLAFRCAEDRMEQLRASVREADGMVWEDDDVAVFLDPGASRGTYFQLEINALGTVYDARNDDRSWASGARTGARRAGDGWALEVAIPWTMLGRAPAPGERWGINLGRQEKPHAQTSAVAPTFKEAAAFADLVFE
ncbi:MAG: carbohydrate-binding family 9-like protein [Candidatus Latescibacterota bacterium]